MQDEHFSPQESLLIIQTMIDKAKNTVADNSFYFLLWGWLVFAASLLQFILKVIIQFPYHYAAWSLMLVGGVVSVFHSVKENRNKKVKTYIEEVLNYLWIGIVISYILLVIIFSRTGWHNSFPFYMMMYAIGSYVTGRALKFSPLVWGAMGSWILAIVSTFTSYDVNILLGALAILVSYIIPGYLLRNKYRGTEINV